MLTWLAVLAILGAAALSLRWYAVGRQDSLGRPIGFPTISVVLLVLLACASAYPGFVRRREETRLGAVASQIAGVKVKVVCQTPQRCLRRCRRRGGLRPLGARRCP